MRARAPMHGKSTDSCIHHRYPYVLPLAFAATGF